MVADDPSALNYKFRIDEVHVVDGRSPSVSQWQHPPNDLLSEIFFHNIPTHYPDPKSAETLLEWQSIFSAALPMNLLGTCRSWRHAALDESTLWATCFIALYDATSEALIMLKHFLRRCIAFSGNKSLDIYVTIGGYMGMCNSKDVYGSLTPLLTCQERWEDMELCCYGVVHDGESNLVLDPNKLSSLKGLTFGGFTWDGIGANVYKSTQGFNLENMPKLPSLRSLRLFDFNAQTCVAILLNSPHLTELALNIEDNLLLDAVFKNKFNLPFPCLRTLDVSNFHYEHGPFTPFHVLQVKALEDLSITGAPFSHRAEFDEFFAHNDLSATLSSLRLEFFSPPMTAMVASFLGHLRSLRFLEIREDWSTCLALLSNLKSDDLRPEVCPMLEDIYIEGTGGFLSQFSALVKNRWNAPERRIRSITFSDCRLEYSFHDRPLTDIPGVNACIQEGLELIISNKPRAKFTIRHFDV